ncbi:DUF7260 family protein [Natrinema salaciae]|uniref:DUF7260 domain-containing protein n=1 Tax=Natrinema salaciae TaxID=1186196 RepID=A0A1H9J2Y7_9EURY|nr:hypothetical protein [Natrinema salaciae]SEQ81193.1 hypothetical protein SAMN04489841_2422 [Natrinema salaciae]
MNGSTAVHGALECIDEERTAVTDRGAAFETFARRVRAVPAERPVSTVSGHATAATPVAMATERSTRETTAATAADRCVTVREAFAETVRPHSIADHETDESLVETLAAELTEDVAVALATETGWTPALKRAVLESVATRRREVESLQELLRSERHTVEDAIDSIEEITAWLRSTADESLLQCDFDALRRKHERLEGYRSRLETLAAERQAQLTESTNRYGRGGTQRRTVVTSIYADLSVRHPVLSSATRLNEICGGCQRTVRAHLTRRV